MSDKENRLGIDISNLVHSILELIVLCKPKRNKKETDKVEENNQ